MKGFTLIEILIALTIIVLLVAVSLPVGFRFYKIQQLNVGADGVVQALRRAQFKAMSMENNSAFGVYVGAGKTGQYILFRGDSFANSEDKEIFDISDEIAFSGKTEIVFKKLEGTPLEPGGIFLTSNDDIKTIKINEAGRVNLEI